MGRLITSKPSRIAHASGRLLVFAAYTSVVWLTATSVTKSGLRVNDAQNAALSPPGSSATPESADEAPRTPYLTDPLDLRQVFGEHNALDGVMYDPHGCFGPLNNTVPPKVGSDKVLKKFRKEIINAVAAIAGVAPGTIDIHKSYFELLGIAESGHSKFVELRSRMTDIAGQYGLHADGTRVFKCGTRQGGGKPIASDDEVGVTGCPEGKAPAENKGPSSVGAFPGALLTSPGSIHSTMKHMQNYGWCHSHPEFLEGFANWFIRERLHPKKWQNFAVENRDEDILLELMDMYYERHHIFLEQRWLGVAVMQDPFDLLSLQNLVYTLKPDLIIETGTANGGSALLWASVLEISELYSSKIITIDVNHPATGFGHTAKTKNPTEHKLWEKYVTFIQGFSTDANVLAKVKEIASTAGTVLVFLDSDHSQGVVQQELDAYCHQFVTMGSYCVVEDTKLSRMGVHGGPLAALDKFMEKTTKFQSDRSHELKYSQHVKGYLKRIAA